MVDVSIVNETSPEANWNRRTGRQADRRTGEQDHVLSQVDALTKKIFLENYPSKIHNSTKIWVLRVKSEINIYTKKFCPKDILV